jgi:DNA-binding protein YbaB
MSFVGKAKQVKDLYKLQKQAKDVQKKLENIHIEAEENGVVVTFNAKQEPISVKIADSALENKPKLEESILNALKKGLKKAQEIAAVNMKDIMDQMGMSMPGTP